MSLDSLIAAVWAFAADIWGNIFGEIFLTLFRGIGQIFNFTV